MCFAAAGGGASGGSAGSGGGAPSGFCSPACGAEGPQGPGGPAGGRTAAAPCPDLELVVGGKREKYDELMQGTEGL